MFILPKLNYSYSSLEPYIDKETMEIHHTKHHQTYVDKLNETLKDYPEFLEMDISELLKNIDKVPADIKQKVINFGGGHYNHTLFWKIITPGYKGSVPSWFARLKDEFTTKSLALFGSGWCWVVKNNDVFEVVTTSNQETPITDGITPVLGIDLWEHSYYLKYQNRRAEYIENFLKLINFEKLNI